jgi:hypothetical protein
MTVERRSFFLKRSLVGAVDVDVDVDVEEML